MVFQMLDTEQTGTVPSVSEERATRFQRLHKISMDASGSLYQLGISTQNFTVSRIASLFPRVWLFSEPMFPENKLGPFS